MHRLALSGACQGSGDVVDCSPLNVGPTSTTLPKQRGRMRAVYAVKPGDLACIASRSQGYCNSGTDASAKWPSARQSRLDGAVSDRKYCLEPKISSNGSKNSSVSASSLNWFCCDVFPSKPDTVSRGRWMKFWGIWPAATAAECSRFRCSAMASRSSEETPRCSVRVFAAACSLGGRIHWFGHWRMEA